MEVPIAIEGIARTVTTIGAAVDPAGLGAVLDLGSPVSGADWGAVNPFQSKHAAPGDVVPAKGPCCGKG